MGLKSALGLCSCCAGVGGGCCFLWDLLSSLGDLNREWPRCTHVGSDAEVSRAWTQTPR